MDKDKKLVITWQRLLVESGTCPRCGSTEDELDKAVLRLREKLNPFGIEVVLEKKEIPLEVFKQNPVKSNTILFNGRSLEEVMCVKTGQSACCGMCGDEKCRTVEIGEKTYEAIPAELICEAGLRAATKYRNE